MDNSDNSDICYSNKYSKYKHKYCELKRGIQKCNLITNQITITLGNMHLFIEETDNNKQILLDCAMKYKHSDIITLLKKN